jgi:uncharacterized membrane protein
VNSVVPAPLWIVAGVTAAAAQIWFWKRTSLTGRSRLAALTLRLAAIGLTAWILSGPERPILETADAHPAVVLTDISRSMEFPDGERTRAERARHILRSLTDSGAPRNVRSFSFGARLVADGLRIPDDDSVRNASLPAAALRELLGGSGGKDAPHSVLLVSDGAAQDEPGLAAVALACKKRGIPIGVICTGGDVVVKNAALLGIDSERRAKAGTKVPVTVTTRQTGLDEPLRVELLDANGRTIDQALTSAAPESAAEQNVTLSVTTGADGFQGKVRIAAVEGEMTLTDNEAPVSIAADNATLRVLYMEGSINNNFGLPEPCYLPWALAETGDVEVDLLCPTIQNDAVLVGWPWKSGNSISPDPSKRYPRTKEELSRYDVIICSDIPRAAFSDEQIRWTVDLVAERGAGFIMIGGITSFGAGFWDRTPWERLIPVDMNDFTRGTSVRGFPVFWPEEGKRHPLLAQLPRQTGEKLETILDAHPQFFGTNVVHRAKPAATVLMQMNDATGQPLIAVQPFGKGRTMAFTSDITFQWGTLHNRAWGPSETADASIAISEFGPRPANAAPFNNGYYKRFWQRSIRWLAENSIRAKGAQFEASTPYLAWPGKSPLPIHAAGPDESMMARLSGVPCVAHIRGISGTRLRLKWDAAAHRFEGLMPRPPGLPDEAIIEVEARDPLAREPRTASFTVRAPHTDPESAEPSARPDVLEALAKATGGKVLHSAAGAAAWLDERTAVLNAPERSGARPAWDRMWVLAAVLLLLSSDWLLRRLTS